MVSYALAAHTAKVSVDQPLVKGGSTKTYTFNLSNVADSSNFIYLITITAPAGFTINGSLSCPAGWTSGNTASVATCTGDPDPGVGLGIAVSGSAAVSFSATAPGADSAIAWTVVTKDNAFVSHTYNPLTTVDATAPTISSITTKDSNGDGRVETATIFFSEAVDDSTFSPANFSLGGQAVNTINTGTADDNTFDIVVDASVAGTGAKDITYTQGTGADMVGNLLADVGSGNIAEVDAAAPRLMSARTQSLTTITATFSEDIDASTLNIGGSEFSVSGHTVTAASEMSLGIITLTVSTPDLSSGETPNITFTSSNFKDLAGVQATSPITLTASDGIAPQITSTRTLTTAIIEVTFTEAMSAVDKTDFAVADNTISNVTFTAGQTTATFVLQNAIGTGATPNVTTIVSPSNTKDNATAPNTITGSLTSTPTDGIAPTITATAPATNAFIKAEKVSYTLSEAAVAASGVITFTQTGGSADGNSPHTCVLQGTALASGAHTDLTLTNDANVCSGWTSLVDGAIYTATFNVSDIAGNLATTVTNTGVTYDVTIPTLATVTIASSNSNLTLAKVGDIITLTIVASENLTSTPTVTITGDAVTTTGSGVNWTATYVMDGSDTEGAVPFTINFTDLATNPGVQVIAKTDGSDVTFDKTPPTAPTVGAFTATGGTAVASYINSTNTGFTVTFTSPADNFAGTAHLYVGGVEFATPVIFAVVAGNTVYTLTGDSASITGLGADGTKALTVVIVDAAGNISTASAASDITKDTSVPTAVLSAATDDIGSVTGALTSGQTTDDTALVLSGTNESGSTVEVFNGSSSLGQATITTTTWSYSATVADGATYQFNVKETDVAGNTSPAISNFTVIGDTAAPLAPVITSIATDGKINNSEKAAVHVVGTAEAGSTVSVSLRAGQQLVQSLELQMDQVYST